MKTMMLSLFIFLSSILLTGCATNASSNTSNDPTKVYVGLFSGAAIGGLAGASVAQGHNRAPGAAIGALVGALIGGGIAMVMDEKDRENALKPPVKAEKSHWEKKTTTVAEENHLSPTTAEKAESSKLLSFWKSLPSTQWFINDAKQVG